MSQISSPALTWHSLLPWLERLGPEELLALQQLGGPVMWWSRETPEETSTRRWGVEDVLELLAAFLESAPLADEHLSLLLPFLPSQKPTGHLDLDGRVLETVEAVGGTTLGEVGRLAPRSILKLPALHWQTKRKILAALVRAGVTLPQRGGIMESQVSAAAGPRSSETPAKVISEWFTSLDDREQDLIIQHLCTPSPVPVELLAARHRTTRPGMAQWLNELPQQLETAAQASTRIRSALAAFDVATRVPVTRTELLERHPWLAVRLPRSDVAVLDVLLALHRSGSTDGEWLFSGSLKEARKVTRDALSLEAGECVTVTATARLLEETGWPLKATDEWLRYCGLRLVEGHQVELDETPRLRSDWTRASRAEDDYVLAPPQNISFDQPQQESVPTATPGDTARELADILEQLRAFGCEHRPGMRLADLLLAKEELPRHLGALTARFLAATAGTAGWELPDVQSIDLPPEVSPAAEHGARRTTLLDRAWTVLNELGHPLASQLLVVRMGADVNIRSLKSQLPSDSRFVRSDVDSWALTEWGLRPYTTIKELVIEEVDQAGGSIPTDKLIAILTREFTVNESSVRQVASSPPFTARGGVVRRLSDVRQEEEASRASAGSAAGSPDDDGPTSDDLIDLMGL